MAKEINIRQRMLGAIVIISFIVIFIPLLLDGDGLEMIVPVADEIIIPKETSPSVKNNSAKKINTAIENNFKTLQKDVNKTAIPKAVKNPIKLNLTAWVIQTASYKTEWSAKSFRDKLLKKGYAAYVEEVGSNSKKRYKVKVGPLAKKVEADKKAKQISKAFRVKPLIVHYP
jgi:cell division septation protein DedD